MKGKLRKKGGIVKGITQMSKNKFRGPNSA